MHNYFLEAKKRGCVAALEPQTQPHSKLLVLAKVKAQLHYTKWEKRSPSEGARSGSGASAAPRPRWPPSSLVVVATVCPIDLAQNASRQ